MKNGHQLFWISHKIHLTGLEEFWRSMISISPLHPLSLLEQTWVKYRVPGIRKYQGKNFPSGKSGNFNIFCQGSENYLAILIISRFAKLPTTGRLATQIFLTPLICHILTQENEKLSGQNMSTEPTDSKQIELFLKDASFFQIPTSSRTKRISRDLSQSFLPLMVTSTQVCM